MVSSSDIPVVRLFLPSDDHDEGLVSVAKLIGLEKASLVPMQEDLTATGWVLLTSMKTDIFSELGWGTGGWSILSKSYFDFPGYPLPINLMKHFFLTPSLS